MTMVLTMTRIYGNLVDENFGHLYLYHDDDKKKMRVMRVMRMMQGMVCGDVWTKLMLMLRLMYDVLMLSGIWIVT